MFPRQIRQRGNRITWSWPVFFRRIDAVVYRLPIILRCPPEEVGTMTRRVLVERISHILALPPDEIDDAMR